MSTPYIILASGQSNMAALPAMVSTHPANLDLWDWNGNVNIDTAVGTAFAAPSSVVSTALSYAAAFAADHPDYDVHVINISIAGIAIAHWLAGASTPDMRLAISNNVIAALTILGVDHVDEMLWWQGESDPASLTYISDFAAVHNWLLAQAWWPIHTQITIFGISALYTAVPQAAFNKYLEALSVVAPGTRRYFHTPDLPAGFWAADLRHLTGTGYAVVGAFAYRAARRELRHIAVDPLTGHVFHSTLQAAPVSGVFWLDREDVNAVSEARMQNSNSGAAAAARQSAVSDAGTLHMTANSVAGGGGATIQWTGTGPLRIMHNGTVLLSG